MVHGRVFRRPSDGYEICIGTSKQAADIIGIQYEAWKTTDLELEKARDMCNKLRTEFEEMTAWKHIKIAFKKLWPVSG